MIDYIKITSISAFYNQHNVTNSLVLRILLIGSFFLVPIMTKADGGNGAAQKLLNDATAFLISPGSYERKEFKDLGGNKTETKIEYIKILADGSKLRRIETELRTAKVLTHIIHLDNEEGSWALRKEIAIHSPSEGMGFDKQMFTDKLDQIDRNKNENENANELELECVTEAGRKFTKIVKKLNEEEMERVLVLAQNVSRRLEDKAARNSDKKKLLKQVTDNIPNRIEYWLDAETNHLVSQRTYTKKGALISERHYDGFAVTAELPIAFFEVPPGYQRLYPERLEDYITLLKKNSSTESIKKKVEAKTPNS